MPLQCVMPRCAFLYRRLKGQCLLEVFSLTETLPSKSFKKNLRISRKHLKR